MRRLSYAWFCALALSVFSSPLSAAPILTLDLRIDAVRVQIQFLRDFSLEFFCDGSVLVACDGSVKPVLDASFRLDDAGAVTAMTAIEMLGDGSVRVAGDGSVVPAGDSLRIEALSYSPNPFMSLSLAFTDTGDPSSVNVGVFGALGLGGSSFDYLLTGDTFVRGGGATAAPITDADFAAAIGVTAIDHTVYGLVDNRAVAGIGGFIDTVGETLLLVPAAGSGVCVTCGNFALIVAFQGSGDGAYYLTNASFDLAAVSAPATLGLLLSGLFSLVMARRRR